MVNGWNIGDFPEGHKDQTGNGRHLTAELIARIEAKEEPYIEPREEKKQ